MEMKGTGRERRVRLPPPPALLQAQYGLEVGSEPRVCSSLEQRGMMKQKGFGVRNT